MTLIPRRERSENMVAKRYTGISNPREEFEALRPAADQLTAMMGRCKPFGTDYCVLLAARTALETAAYHFTNEPHLYSAKAHSG